MPRYVVYYVLGDGNVVESCNTSDPFIALAWMEKDQERFKGHRHHAHGVFDPDRDGDDCDVDIEAIVHDYDGDAVAWREDMRAAFRASAGRD